VIDLDVLSFGHEVFDEPGLTVPHPRMHERAFVLVPLLELDPDPILPGGRRAASLRLVPAAVGEVRPFAAAIPTPVPDVPQPPDSPGAGTRPDVRRA
jgi:2-amino-4-hydroxy-6-hydroxymethyldihydropteridine diphosphokinase